MMDVLTALFALHVAARSKLCAARMELSRACARLLWMEDRSTMLQFLTASEK